MHLIWKIALISGTFLLMEGVAWATHKYVMHGFMWRWHRSHHKVHPHTLERNDLFAVVFSIPSIVLIISGYEFATLFWLKYIGFGVLAYGIFYFLFHDILVHRRIRLPINPKSGYLRRIMNAHYVHHQKHTKEDGEAFGFLYAPKKYSLSSESKKVK